MSSIYATSLAAAAADRKLTPAALTATIEAGPYSADEAKAKGLIDNVGEEREAEAAILKAAGAGAKLAEFGDYAQRARAAQRASLASLPTIALIEAEGDIVTGTGSRGGTLGGGSTIYADDVADAFYKAIEDKDVKAIVFRLNSPGGSDTASEQILSAVRAARTAGKPVVVSMGEYGASGRLLGLLRRQRDRRRASRRSPARLASSAASWRSARRWRSSASTCAA